MQEMFTKLAMTLPHIKTFERFTKAISLLGRKFPNTVPWICWYLHTKRRRIIFKACKNISDEQHKSVIRLLRTTNGQEGLGGFLKQSIGKKCKLVGNTLLEFLATWVQTFEDAIQLARVGHRQTYHRHTKEEKRKLAEKKMQYKAPDGIRMMDRCGNQLIRQFPRKSQYPSTIPHEAPPQLRNVSSCCFANALLQNIFASEPLRIAFLPDTTSMLNKPEEERCIQFTLVQRALKRMEMMVKKPGVIEPDWVLALLQHWDNDSDSNDYRYGGHADPMEFFSYIIGNMERKRHPVHSRIMNILSLSKIVLYESCKCKTGLGLVSVDNRDGHHCRLHCAYNIQLQMVAQLLIV